MKERLSNKELKCKKLPHAYDHLAPDGSEIRTLLEVSRGGLAHCLLPGNEISRAVKHKTVEEIWYVLAGQGEMWRKNDLDEQTTKLTPGVSITIPVNTHFQFRNTAKVDLKLLIATMPCWPGKEEAVPVQGKWPLDSD